MFGNVLIGFLVGISLSAWTYSKLMHSSGSNTKSSLTAAVIAGLVAWLIVTAVLGLIFN